MAVAKYNSSTDIVLLYYIRVA